MKPRSPSPEDFESCGKRGKGHVGPLGAFAGDVSARLKLLGRDGGGGGGGSGGANANASASGSGSGRLSLFSPALLAVFCVGVALGVVASERLYLAGALSVAASGPLMTTATTTAATAAAAAALAPPPPAPSSCPCARPAAGAGSNHSSWLTPLPRRERRELAGLESYLLKIAPSREVLVALSDANPLREGMLDTFLRGAADVARITNYVVVALDRETEAALKARGRNAFYMSTSIPESQRETGANHAISALKFGVLRKFLSLGWSVLLSDVDVAVLSDPFFGGKIWRDSDIEGMSDGFDPPTAYGAIDGYEDVSMGWSRYAQLYKRFNLNSGLFFARSNDRTVELMRRLEARLSRQKYWDQTAYNEELFFLPHGDYSSPQVTVRVMDIYAFMNSKVLFKDVRRRAAADRPAERPCMVHINYHPDKHARMRAVFAHYVDGDATALDGFPGGSEPGT